MDTSCSALKIKSYVWREKKALKQLITWLIPKKQKKRISLISPLSDRVFSLNLLKEEIEEGRRDTYDHGEP